MSHQVWPKLVHFALLAGLLATGIPAQDPNQDPSVPAQSEPGIRFEEPTSSPAPTVETEPSGSEADTPSPESEGTPTQEPETEASAMPEAEDRILASLSPASTWLWIHFKDWKAVLAGDADQQASQALRELARRDGALVGRIRDFLDGLAGFASSHGFKREGFLDLVAEEAELSFFETSNQPDFLLYLPVGGKEAKVEEVLRGFWKAWKPDAQGNPAGHAQNLWYAKSPYPYTKEIFASIEGNYLIFTGSPEAMDLGHTLAQEKGAALAFDEAFQSLFGDSRDTKKSGWFQFFARPRKAARWIFGDDQNHRTSRSFLTSLPAIGFESRFEGGMFHDRIHLGIGDPGRGLSQLLGQGNVDPGFAATIRNALPDSIRTRISWSGLQNEMRDNPQLSLTFAALKGLEEKLANTGEGKSLGEALALLTGDMAWLPGDGEHTQSALVLAMKDAFQCKSLLESLGTPIPENEGSTDPTGYVLSLAGQSWYAWMDKNYVYVSRDSQRCQTLRSVLASQSSDDPKKKPTETALLEGRINSLTWLREKDPSGTLGLLALAEWFDNPSISVHKADKSYEIESQAVTGVLPFALVSIDQLLGRLDLRQSAWNKDLALEFSEGIFEAQKTFMLLTEKDEDGDGKGEAGTLTELIAARRVAEARQYRPWGMDVYERSGYRFRVILPSKVDDRESKFFLLAWPNRLNANRPTCILLDNRGQLYTNELASALDLDSGPEPGQIFSGDPFDSALAAGWERKATQAETTAKDPKTAAEPDKVTAVKDLDLEAALTLLDEAWKAKDADHVRAFLDYENVQIQARAAHYLGNLKDKKSVPTLAGLLRESLDQPLRRSAARALSLIRDPRATASLLECLTDADAIVRLQAATAFIANPVPGSLDALLALVDSYTGDEAGDRSQAMLAIHDLDRPGCLKDLVAVKAGGSLFQQALVYTFQDLSPKLEEADEARVLIAALPNENKLLRKYAIQRLGEAGYKEAVSALKQRLGDESEELQPILQNTLAVLSPSMGTQKLKENLQVLLAKGKTLARKAKTRFDALPEPHRYAIMGGGGFILLLILFLLGRRRKRKKAARRAQVLELVEHSDEFQAQAEAPDEAAYDEQAWSDDGQGDGYQEEQEVYEEEESYH